MTPAVTYLFVPADRPDRFAKALASGADMVILDLEDAVRPEAKPAAREAILSAGLDWARVAIRINDAASPELVADLELLVGCRAAAVMVPKAETAAALERIRAAAGRPIRLLPQIETARGLHAATDLLAVPGAERAVFGHLDFALDIGAAPEWEALLFARSQLVIASRLAGAQSPVDSITTDLTDPGIAGADAAAARRLGFGGKLLIHPKQVRPVARAFAPTASERLWAAQVIAAIQGAPGAVALDGRMIDRPVEEAARRILARAEAADA